MEPAVTATAIAATPKDFAVGKYNEYHRLLTSVPFENHTHYRFERGTCTFITGLLSPDYNGICGSLDDLKTKIELIQEFRVRFCVFFDGSDASLLKEKGFLPGLNSMVAFIAPATDARVELPAQHSILKVNDGDTLLDWNNFFLRSIRDPSTKSERLRFFQEHVIKQSPLTHYIYRISDKTTVTVAALSAAILGDALLLCNSSTTNPAATEALVKHAINEGLKSRIVQVITYMTFDTFPLTGSTTAWTYRLHFKI